MKPPPLNPADVGKAMKARQWAWVDQQMEKHLPKHLYRGAHVGDTNALKRIKEKGYNLVFEQDGVVQFRRGETVLASAKFVLEIDTADDFIRLAKSCLLRQGGE